MIQKIAFRGKYVYRIMSNVQLDKSNIWNTWEEK